jgi:hypothetical protein
MGTASKKIARPIGPFVKSRDEPRTASRRIGQKELFSRVKDAVSDTSDINEIFLYESNAPNGAGTGGLKSKRCRGNKTRK